MRASVCASSVLPEPVGPIRGCSISPARRHCAGLIVEPLVVIVNCDRQNLLRLILADDIVVEDLADFLGGRNSVARLHQRGFVLLADDVHTKFNAFVADKNGRPGNELAHFVLALAAERAVEGVLGILPPTLLIQFSVTLPYSSWLVPLQRCHRLTKQVSHRTSSTRGLTSEGLRSVHSPSTLSEAC